MFYGALVNERRPERVSEFVVFLAKSLGLTRALEPARFPAQRRPELPRLANDYDDSVPEQSLKERRRSVLKQGRISGPWNPSIGQRQAGGALLR